MIARLGVNVDHVATVRNARGTLYPDPLEAAKLALNAGAYGITVHLREDRRHIRDEDVWAIRKVVKSKLNLEMALTEEMVRIAKELKPDYVCLVPEKRQELTTEGGLSLAEIDAKRKWIQEIKKAGIKISLFMAARPKDLEQAIRIAKPDAIELHTGDYAHAFEDSGALDELHALETCGKLILSAELECHAGHGLHLDNLEPLCSLYLFQEYNIGHAIIAQSIFESLPVVVQKYVSLMSKYPLA